MADPPSFIVTVLPRADSVSVLVCRLASEISSVPASDSVSDPTAIWPVNWSSCAEVSVSPPEKPVIASTPVTLTPTKVAALPTADPSIVSPPKPPA